MRAGSTVTYRLLAREKPAMKTLRIVSLFASVALLAACAGTPDTSAYQKDRAAKGQAELDRNIDRQQNDE